MVKWYSPSPHTSIKQCSSWWGVVGVACVLRAHGELLRVRVRLRVRDHDAARAVVLRA